MSRILVACLGLMSTLAGAAEPRARDLGIPFEGTPGPLNAITDVAGVTVGQVTLIKDLTDGRKVRTGVTAILPRGRATLDIPVFGGWFSLNGNGEMTGTAWLEESGSLEGPVLLTNTHSVGVVRDAAIAWRVRAGAADASGYWWSLPVVAETWDGELNDINGFHVRPEHVDAALSGAQSGPVAEGNVGGGTGMICHEFKCGIGTASRVIGSDATKYTLGVLVQANYGVRDSLLIAGAPVGQHLRNDRIYSAADDAAGDTGSIIIVIATDAPLLPHQLERISRRAGMGLARMGSIRRQRIGRSVRRLLDREPSRPCRRRNAASHVPGQRQDGSALRRDRAGHRGSDHQRAHRCARHAGHRGSLRQGDRSRGACRGAQALRATGRATLTTAASRRGAADVRCSLQKAVVPLDVPREAVAQIARDRERVVLIRVDDEP